MVELICVPRINALGLKGPEKSCDAILRGRRYSTLNIVNEEIDVDEKKIYEAAKKSLHEKCLFVGGDHSITFPIGKGFLDRFGEEDSLLIVFDAHADCMESMEEPTHEEIIYGLVKSGWKSENIILIGLRKIESEELDFLREKGILYFEAGSDLDNIIEAVLGRGEGKKVYVSIDIDVFDPKIAPGVNYPESGGLSKDDFFYLLDKVCAEMDVQAYDLVEVVLDKDVDAKTVEIAKEVVEKILN